MYFLIDRKRVVNSFRSLLSLESMKNILLITGEPKMGKSRLLQEFRKLALENDYLISFIDLRAKHKSYSDILNSISNQIGEEYFENYKRISQELLLSSQMNLSRITQVFSILQVHNTDNTETIQVKRQLLKTFVYDLKSIKEKNILIILDTFDQADETIQKWVNENFLPDVQDHKLIIVIAGRALPVLLSSTQDRSESYNLTAVTVDDHREYCDLLGIEVDDNVLSAFHNAFEGTPGLFAEYVTKLKK